MAANSSGFGKKAALWAFALVTIVLFAAWFHGGEEPLHVITLPVEIAGFEQADAERADAEQADVEQEGETR